MLKSIKEYGLWGLICLMFNGCNNTHRTNLSSTICSDSIVVKSLDFECDSNNFICKYRAPFGNGTLVVTHPNELRETYTIQDSVIDGECNFYVGNLFSGRGYFDKCQKAKTWTFYGGLGLCRIETYKDDLLDGPLIRIIGNNKFDTTVYKQGLLMDYKCSDSILNMQNKKNFRDGNGCLVCFDFDSIEITNFSHSSKNGSYMAIDNTGFVSGTYRYNLKEGYWVYTSHWDEIFLNFDSILRNIPDEASQADILFGEWKNDHQVNTWFLCKKDSALICLLDYNYKNHVRTYRINGLLKYKNRQLVGPSGKVFNINDPSIRR